MAQPTTEWRTSEKHFRIFKTECLRLAKLWGLNDWRIHFTHEAVEAGNAECRADSISRVVTVALSVSWNARDGNGDKFYAPSDAEMRVVARHEMAHLLTADLYNIGQRRWVTADEWRQAAEAIARKLHGLLP